jgi:mannosyl-3-phosphoglycerate phosphatase
MKLLIFTDLDGTLLNQEDYDYRPALPLLQQLQQQEIPVIPVTSKTRAEVVSLCSKLGLKDSLIVENGSGIFVPLHTLGLAIADLQSQDGYHVQLFGCSYGQTRIALKAIADELGTDLRGFGDLGDAEIQKLTNLPLIEVKKAKTREFTEPFLTPTQIDPDKLQQAAQKRGFRVVVGDRFSHLIAVTAGKDKAVKWLTQQYLSQNRLVTIGLGNSPNDLEMLETVDVPIIVPGTKGVHPGLRGKHWQIAPDQGSRGWAMAVTAIIEKLGILI